MRSSRTTVGLHYWCSAYRKGFSVQIGTAPEQSRVALRKWVFVIYLETIGLKGISSMKLRRDIKVTQQTAWFMLDRIRLGPPNQGGLVHRSRCAILRPGRG